MKRWHVYSYAPRGKRGRRKLHKTIVAADTRKDAVENFYHLCGNERQWPVSASPIKEKRVKQ